MKNDLLTIGSFTVHGYGLMIAIGIAAAFFTAEYRAKKMKLSHERIFPMAMWAILGGAIGAKLLYYITQIKEILANPALLLKLADGFVLYGAILGGIVAVLLYCRKAKLNSLQYFDVVIPSVALAQGFGRLGCFLAGCCYGVEAHGPLSIVFHESDFAPNGIPLIPTQLIASGLNFLNFLVLVLLAKRKRADGQIIGLYLLFYSAGRFVLEFYRGDLIRGNVGSLSTSQFISLFMFAAGLAMLLITTFKSRKACDAEQAAS